MKKSICILISIFSFSVLFAKDIESEKTKMREKLEKTLGHISIKEMENKAPFLFTWEIRFDQILDHNNPAAGTFRQRLFLYHKSYKSPTVFVTEGYELRDRIYEPTLILNANQISVEYRYFDQSIPENLDWKYLKISQALEDLHAIRLAFKSIYKKPWLSTGISKGGTTTALYSLTYPKDVKASVAYVAPFVLAQEDKRTQDFYNHKVSTPECRKRVRDFQKTLLLHRAELVPMIEQLAITEQVSFPMSIQNVIDYSAVEYPFSFWQWGFGCQEIPPMSASAQEIFEHMETVVDFNFYDNKSYAELLPAFYEFMTEYGYYGFDTTGISDLLIEKKLSNLTFCPKNTDLTYHPEYMRRMEAKAKTDSRHIIYIYGGVDTWTSCAIELDPKADAKKFIHPNGGHRTRIRNFSAEEKEKIYKTIGKWMKSKTVPLPY